MSQKPKTKVSFNLTVEIEDISAKIKKRRRSLKLSVRALARKIETSEKTIYNLETPNCQYAFSEAMILKVEKALDIALLPTDEGLLAELIPLRRATNNSRTKKVELFPGR